jgi:hypothetical protein
MLAFLLVASLAQDHHHMGESAAESILLQQASGTSAAPAGESRPMTMFSAGSWMVMVHGIAFLNDTHQNGFRGRNKSFSTNWGMAMAERPLGDGAIMLRAMLSAEPATISGRKYPELFQTGETAFGQQIIDGQHPHDFFMELAAEYARPIGSATGFVYVAPVGEPAIGPVAFPHRQSAMEIPQAVLSHHFQDSTHIAYNVVTAGVAWSHMQIEGSVFHGAEPDENRWNIDGGRIDSAAGRVTLKMTPNLLGQASFAYLTKPEKLEPGDAKRTTASISYARGGLATSLIWGRAYKESHDQTLESYLAESTLHLGRHWIAARFENAQKDELFPHIHRSPVITRPTLPAPTFRVKAATIGYTWDFLIRGSARYGIGANYTAYRFPQILKVFYGEKPRAQMIYLRTRWGV